MDILLGLLVIWVVVALIKAVTGVDLAASERYGESDVDRITSAKFRSRD